MAMGLIPVTYILSYFLSSRYTESDQIQYHKFYNALNGARIDEVMALALFYVSSAEPLSAFILWFGSNLGFEKDVYISILNVILIVGLFLLARQHRVKMPLIFLLLTNFYVVVLMVAAERLKIAYIFLILSVLFEGRVRLLLLTLTPLAHLQSILLLMGVITANNENFIKKIIFKFSLSRKSIKSVILLSSLVVIFGIFLYEGILQKITAYASSDLPLFVLLNIAILWSIAIYVSRNRIRMFLALLPMIPAVAILGGDRVNMIAFTLVIYFLMEERRLNHPLIYILMTYLSIKTIPFVYKIILYGDGFVN